jgi:hypothetical protein
VSRAVSFLPQSGHSAAAGAVETDILELDTDSLAGHLAGGLDRDVFEDDVAPVAESLRLGPPAALLPLPVFYPIPLRRRAALLSKRRSSQPKPGVVRPSDLFRGCMSKPLESRHRLYLLSLVVAGGAQWFSEKLVPSITHRDLQVLADLRLITVTAYPRRRTRIELTNSGCERVLEELSAKTPRGTGGFKLWYRLLGRLKTHMERSGLVLADIFPFEGAAIPPPSLPEPKTPKPGKPRPSKPRPRTVKAKTPGPLPSEPPPDPVPEERIRAAYDRLKEQEGGWVGLAALRAELADCSREALDRALLVLADRGDARFVPVVDQMSLTEADRAAALSLGGMPNHKISMG